MLDFEGDVYGKEIEIEFHHYLRPIEKFNSLDDLKAQLEKDKAYARKYFEQKK